MEPDTEHRSAAERRRQLLSWAKGAAFMDNGVLRTWYHGTEVHEPFNIFTRWDEASVGFHFGAKEVANDRIKIIFRMVRPEENEGIIIPVHCRAQNPLRLSDHYCWRMDRVVDELIAFGIMTEEVGEKIIETIDDAMMFAAIELAGFDAIVYANECEFKDRRTDSLLIWRSELLKSPWASSFDKDDPRLLPQNATAEQDLRSWRRMNEEIEAAKVRIQELSGAFSPA